jgi:hypothetical protein
MSDSVPFATSECIGTTVFQVLSPTLFFKRDVTALLTQLHEACSFRSLNN